MYYVHGVIIYIIQISSLVVFEKLEIKSPFQIVNNVKKNKPIELQFLILISLLLINLILPFKYALHVNFALLSIITYTLIIGRNNSYLNIIFFLILSYFTFVSGFLGGDRRFFIFYIIIIFIFFSHVYKIKIGNIIFILLVPFFLVLFYFQGLFRVFGWEEGFDRLSRLSFTSLYNILENIDIGVFSRIYEALFENDLFIYIRESYLTGLSFERVFYLMIPRQIWPEKPHNLSYIAGEYAYPGNSAPISLPMEFYVNFGLWLSPLCFLSSQRYYYLDKQYNNSRENILIFYFFMVAFFWLSTEEVSKPT